MIDRIGCIVYYFSRHLPEIVTVTLRDAFHPRLAGFVLRTGAFF